MNQIDNTLYTTLAINACIKNLKLKKVVVSILIFFGFIFSCSVNASEFKQPGNSGVSSSDVTKAIIVESQLPDGTRYQIEAGLPEFINDSRQSISGNEDLGRLQDINPALSSTSEAFQRINRTQNLKQRLSSFDHAISEAFQRINKTQNLEQYLSSFDHALQAGDAFLWAAEENKKTFNEFADAAKCYLDNIGGLPQKAENHNPAFINDDIAFELLGQIESKLKEKFGDKITKVWAKNRRDGGDGKGYYEILAREAEQGDTVVGYLSHTGKFLSVSKWNSISGLVVEDPLPEIIISAGSIIKNIGKTTIKALARRNTKVLDGIADVCSTLATKSSQGITKASKKRFKKAIINLSKPNNQGLSQQKLNQLRRIANKADAKVRVDLNGVKGTGVRPHAHVEGMGSKVESRHIWLQQGVK